MSNVSDSKIKIAIIGGGPGGALLGRILQQGKVEFTLFELEKSIDARTQGGSLDIHPETGIKALKAAGLWPEITKHLRLEGEDTRILNKYNESLYEEVGTGAEDKRPEIDRPKLREVILSSINPEFIKWNHNLRKIEQNANNKFTLYFQDSIESDFDLVVGADGAWSQVRKLLDPTLPHYSGIFGVELNFTNVDSTHPEISKLVGRGIMSALHDHKAIMGQRCGDGSIKGYLYMRKPETYQTDSQIDWVNESSSSIKEKLKKEFEGWSPELLKMIDCCDEGKIYPRGMYMLPVGHRWNRKNGVTLIGDAAHLMTPFAGEGVNLALIDAHDLGMKIVAGGYLEKGLEEYEEEMYRRSKEEAEGTWNNVGMMFQENSAVALRDFFLSVMGPPPDV